MGLDKTLGVQDHRRHPRLPHIDELLQKSGQFQARACHADLFAFVPDHDIDPDLDIIQMHIRIDIDGECVEIFYGAEIPLVVGIVRVQIVAGLLAVFLVRTVEVVGQGFVVNQKIIAPLEGLLVPIRFLEKSVSLDFRFRILKPPLQENRVGKAPGQGQLPAYRLLDLLGLEQSEVLCIGPAEMGLALFQDMPADQYGRAQCHQAGQN